MHQWYLNDNEKLNEEIFLDARQSLLNGNVIRKNSSFALIIKLRLTCSASEEHLQTNDTFVTVKRAGVHLWICDSSVYFPALLPWCVFFFFAFLFSLISPLTNRSRQMAATLILVKLSCSFNFLSALICCEGDTKVIQRESTKSHDGEFGTIVEEL